MDHMNLNTSNFGTNLMKKKTFLAGMLMVFYTGFGIAQQPAPVRVEGGLVQGTSEERQINCNDTCESNRR